MVKSAPLTIKLEATAIGVFSLGLLLITMVRVLDIFDEGVILTGATRVLHGEMVHRDFSTEYGPAQILSRRISVSDLR
jgi:hypothetical protein